MNHDDHESNTDGAMLDGSGYVSTSAEQAMSDTAPTPRRRRRRGALTTDERAAQPTPRHPDEVERDLARVEHQTAEALASVRTATRNKAAAAVALEQATQRHADALNLHIQLQARTAELVQEQERAEMHWAMGGVQ